MLGVGRAKIHICVAGLAKLLTRIKTIASPLPSDGTQVRGNPGNLGHN
jgi:hypothetical protein